MKPVTLVLQVTPVQGQPSLFESRPPIEQSSSLLTPRSTQTSRINFSSQHRWQQASGGNCISITQTVHMLTWKTNALTRYGNTGHNLSGPIGQIPTSPTVGPRQHVIRYDGTLQNHTNLLKGPTNVPKGPTNFLEGPTSVLRTTLTYISH